MTKDEIYEMLMKHTLTNAKIQAYNEWEKGDKIGIVSVLNKAIDNCENGTATVEDWSVVLAFTSIS